MPYPYEPKPTSRKFYVPKTLAADFAEFLENDIPNMVMDFTVLKSWYDQFEENYEPQIIRGEIYSDTTKSRYSNTDNNMNFRAAVDSGIRKGDMIIDDKGTIYVLDWEVALQSNNAPSRALRCNMTLKITRRTRVETDPLTGMVLPDEDGIMHDDEEDYDKIIVHDIPANAYRYDGRPEYVSISGTPGASPNALTLMTVQYNDETKNIRIDDEFIWGNEIYHIVDVNRVGVNFTKEHGTLTLQAKKKPGGILESNE